MDDENNMVVVVEVVVVQYILIIQEINLNICEGRLTRYNFVACDMLTTSLRHELFRVNQTYNLLAIVVYDTENVVSF